MGNFSKLFDFTLGLDGITLLFIILTASIFVLCSFITHDLDIGQKLKSCLNITVFFLGALLFIIFISLDLFLFYVCFETSLIPMFFMIGY